MNDIAVYDNATSARELTDKELMARMRTGVITAEEMDEIEFRVRGTTETPSGEATDADVANAYDEPDGEGATLFEQAVLSIVRDAEAKQNAYEVTD